MVLLIIIPLVVLVLFIAGALVGEYIECKKAHEQGEKCLRDYF